MADRNINIEVKWLDKLYAGTQAHKDILNCYLVNESVCFALPVLLQAYCMLNSKDREKHMASCLNFCN